MKKFGHKFLLRTKKNIYIYIYLRERVHTKLRVRFNLIANKRLDMANMYLSCMYANIIRVFAKKKMRSKTFDEIHQM